MFESVKESLLYFKPEVVKWHAPASQKEIANAEERLQTHLPPSVRCLLMTSNGLEVDDTELYGVSKGDETRKWGMIPDSLRLRACKRTQQLDVESMFGANAHSADLGAYVTRIQIEAVYLASAVVLNSHEDCYILLPECKDERGEYAVAQINHEGLGITSVVASSYERFLWFLVDDLRRQLEPDGKLRLVADVFQPWPRGDREWMLHNDPDLVRWIDSV